MKMALFVVWLTLLTLFYKVRQSTSSIGRLVHRMVVGECHWFCVP